MDISLTELFGYASAVTAPVVAYTGWVHSQIRNVHKRVDERVKKEDYREDITDIKDMMKEMRGDIKAILGVPPQ